MQTLWKERQHYAEPWDTLLSSIGSHGKEVGDTLMAERRSLVELLRDAKSIINEKLSAKDAESFLDFLLGLGTRIAGAPTEGREVTSEEVQVLTFVINLVRVL